MNKIETHTIYKILFQSLSELYMELNKTQIEKIQTCTNLYNSEKKNILIQETNEYSALYFLFPLAQKYCSENNIRFFYYLPRKYEAFSFYLIENILEFIYNNSSDIFLEKYPKIKEFILNIENKLYYNFLELVEFIIKFGKTQKKAIVIFLQELHFMNSFEKYFFYILGKQLNRKENLSSKITLFFTTNINDLDPMSMGGNLSDSIKFTTIIKCNILKIEQVKEHLSHIFEKINPLDFEKTINNVFIKSKGNIFQIREILLYLINLDKISLTNGKFKILIPLKSPKEIPNMFQILQFNLARNFIQPEIDLIEEIIFFQLNNKKIIQDFLQIDSTFLKKLFNYEIIINSENNEIAIPQPFSKLISVSISNSQIVEKFKLIIQQSKEHISNLNGYKKIELLSEIINLIVHFLDFISQNDIKMDDNEKDSYIKTISSAFNTLIPLVKKITYPPETNSDINYILIAYLKKESNKYHDLLERIYLMQIESYEKQLNYTQLIDTYRDIIDTFKTNELKLTKFKIDFINILINHKELNEFNEALKYLKEIKDIVFNSNDYSLISNYFLVLGHAYFYHYKLKKASIYYEKSKKIADETDDKLLIAKVNLSLITLAVKQKKYDKGLSKLQNIKDSLNQNSKLYRQCISIESSILFNLNLKKEAYILYLKQLYLSRLHFDKLNILNALNKIGWLYYTEGFFKTAKTYYLDYMSLVKTTKERYSISVGLYNLALLYFSTGKFDKALQLLADHITISKQLKHKRALIDGISMLSSIYKEQNEYNKALEAYNDIIELCNAEKLNTETTMYEIADLYYKKKEYGKTLEYLKKSILEIGNSKKDMLKFKIFLLNQKASFMIGNDKEQVISILDKKLKEKISPPQKADLYYTLYIITSSLDYKKLAIENYRILYIENPIYKYIKVLNKLGSESVIEEL